MSCRQQICWLLQVFPSTQFTCFIHQSRITPPTTLGPLICFTASWHTNLSFLMVFIPSYSQFILFKKTTTCCHMGQEAGQHWSESARWADVILVTRDTPRKTECYSVIISQKHRGLWWSQKAFNVLIELREWTKRGSWMMISCTWQGYIWFIGFIDQTKSGHSYKPPHWHVSFVKKSFSFMLNMFKMQLETGSATSPGSEQVNIVTESFLFPSFDHIIKIDCDAVVGAKQNSCCIRDGIRNHSLAHRCNVLSYRQRSLHLLTSSFFSV